MKIIFILNRNAGKGKAYQVYQKLKKSIDALENSQTFITKTPGELKSICSVFASEDCKVVALGGDGTVNSIINGLGADSQCQLAVVPIGSGNDFAKEFSWYNEKDYNKILEQIVHSTNSRYSDVGKISYSTNEKEFISHLFLSSCGIGFDALVSAMSRKIKYLRGLPLYLASVVKSLSQYEAVEINKSSNKEIVGSKLMISVGNTKYAGGGFMLNPSASISDGIFNACIPQFMRVGKILQVLPKAINGTHIGLPEVENIVFSSLVIELSKPNYLHADGEVLTNSAKSLEIVCLQNNIRLVN